MTPHAIQILQSWIRPTDRGIEWGTGRSTLWFATRVKHLVSIEHNSDWYEKTLIRLRKRRLVSKVDYRLLPLNGEPIAIPPTMGRTMRIPYVEAVNDFPNESFDFALVDGKLRHICLETVLPKIRPAGMLILDNSERYVPADSQRIEGKRRNAENEVPAEWECLLSSLKSWRTIGTTNGIWCTRFWIKPC
jgi:predicted O-methyltransferase YrrM